MEGGGGRGGKKGQDGRWVGERGRREGGEEGWREGWVGVGVGGPPLSEILNTPLIMSIHDTNVSPK